MREIIDKLFMDGMEPKEVAHPTKPEHIQALNTCKRLEKELQKKLTDEQIVLFEEYMTEYAVKRSYEQEEYFALGMAMGIRLTSEAFLLKSEE